MLKFKLKKEAKNFFKDAFHNKTESLKYWTEIGVSQNALEEVPKYNINLGVKLAHDSSTKRLTSYTNRVGELFLTLQINDCDKEYFSELKNNKNIQAALLDYLSRSTALFFRLEEFEKITHVQFARKLCGKVE